MNFPSLLLHKKFYFRLDSRTMSLRCSWKSLMVMSTFFFVIALFCLLVIFCVSGNLILCFHVKWIMQILILKNKNENFEIFLKFSSSIHPTTCNFSPITCHFNYKTPLTNKQQNYQHIIKYLPINWKFHISWFTLGKEKKYSSAITTINCTRLSFTTAVRF